MPTTCASLAAERTIYGRCPDWRRPRDIVELIALAVLRKADAGRRSTAYEPLA